MSRSTISIPPQETKQTTRDYLEALERLQRAHKRLQTLDALNIQDGEVREALLAHRRARHAYLEAKHQLFAECRQWVGTIFGRWMGRWC